MSSRAHPTRELATVLFTDIVDSTQQLAHSGDQAWARVLDALDAMTRSEARRRGGELIKNTGDGALLLLPSPTAAIEGAAALHAAAGQLGVALRIGVHTGEVERRGLDVAGIAVHVAARLMGSAGAGETVTSATTRALASTTGDDFEDLGHLELKGVAEPVPAYVVRPVETAAPPPPPVRSDADSVNRLLQQRRFEEAAELASGVEAGPVADALLHAGGRTEFLDVDVTLVRLLRDVLERLETDPTRRARVCAKLAFELRGDPSTVGERKDLLELASRLAEEAQDDAVTSEVVLATIHSLWEPAGVADRLEAAERVIALTRRTHDVDHELEARLARVHALVESWRVHEAGLELATYARLAARLDRPDVNVFVASRRAMLADISGRYDEQLRQGEIAYQHAVAAGMPDAARLRMAHLWPVARDCAVDTEVFEQGVVMLRELADIMPGNYYETDVAKVVLVLGRLTEARTELARALPPLLGSTGYRWLASAMQAAEVAAELATDEVCQRLYDALLPHQDRLVTIGPNFNGAVGDRLGVLATRLGRLDEALDHLRRTVSRLDEIAALPWAARTRAHLATALRLSGDAAGAERELAVALDVARALGAHRLVEEIGGAEPVVPPDVWTLSREGDDWLLAAGPEQARLRDSRGFQHLALLLANPGTEIAAQHLDTGDASPAESGLPVLDEQALRSYRHRLAEIDTEQEAADRAGDQGAAVRFEEERQYLLAELRSATGLGGRTREVGGSAERARVNVTRNLKRAIDQVQKVAPLAGAHLAASVRTGTHCAYLPAAGGPAGWHLP